MPSFKEAWEDFNARWQEDRRHRIDALIEADSAKRRRRQPPPGTPYKLSQRSSRTEFHGQLRLEGTHWHFQEDGTGFQVSVQVPSDMQGRQSQSWRDEKLCKALLAEHARQRRQAKASLKQKAARANFPQS
eukprot:3287449-Karenia_brevis.AAC.1